MIVICPDSFKGSLTSKEVTSTLSEAFHKKRPKLEILELPLADGGEETSAILSSTFPNVFHLYATDPLGKRIETQFFIDSTGKKAFIESAKIIGLPLVTYKERNPLKTSSFGLGEVINEALRLGCNDIIVSLGGSATCDGGLGMLKALNHTYLNANFTILCDVDNPLLGMNGAVKIFAPQKGAKPEDIPILEKRLENLVEEAKKRGLYNKGDEFKAGSGAAGGLGFAFQTFLKAKSIKGIDFILKKLKFSELIRNAQLIITGEGKLDSQSLMGKVLSGVLEEAKKQDIPVIAIGGLVEDETKLLEAGLQKVYSISDPNKTLEENMLPETAIKNLHRIAELIELPKH